jgi:hypothetical protein
MVIETAMDEITAELASGWKDARVVGRRISKESRVEPTGAEWHHFTDVTKI